MLMCFVERVSEDRSAEGLCALKMAFSRDIQQEIIGNKELSVVALACGPNYSRF